MEAAPRPGRIPDTTRDATPHVLVAVTTYRRAHLLDPLLREIRAQCDASPHDARLLVVDNDAARSAEAHARHHGVDYLCVRTPGIAAARQGALDAADDGDLLVMIDDDVTPQQHWLDELVAVWQETHATAVMGHVHYVWPPTCDPWLVDTGYMRRTRHPRGHTLDHLATTNVLLDVHAVRTLGVGFDLSLGTGGSEDTTFGRDVIAAGGTIVAASDSVVRDDVPAQRATREFAYTRTVAHGQALTHLLITQAPPRLRRVRAVHELAGGVIRLMVFTLGALVVAVGGDRRGNAVLTRRSWFARGRILGALGHRESVYARETADS